MTYRQLLLSGAMSFIIAKKEDIRPAISRNPDWQLGLKPFAPTVEELREEYPAESNA